MLAAVVPAYNEAQMIGSVVRDLFEQVDMVVVVDDGSTDATAAAAAAARAIVIRHPLNRGQGAAIQTGHEYALLAGAEYVVHFDADAQFDAADIRPALMYLQAQGAEVLFGSRFLDTRSKIPWFKKLCVLPLARLISRCVGGLALSDAHNGFRILSRTALAHIRITHDRMAHASEIPALVHRSGLPYVEFPVRVVYREYGQGVSGGLAILKDLFLGRFLKS